MTVVPEGVGGGVELAGGGGGPVIGPSGPMDSWRGRSALPFWMGAGMAAARAARARDRMETESMLFCWGMVLVDGGGAEVAAGEDTV